MPTHYTREFKTVEQASAKEADLLASNYVKVIGTIPPGPGQFTRRLAPSQPLGTLPASQGRVLAWCSPD